MPICWVHQAAAGVAAVRKPGRVMDFMAGGVRICVFDEEINAWAYPVVKPITLRNIDPAAMAALEGFERRVPVAGLESCRYNSAPAMPSGCSSPEPHTDEPPVRLELHMGRKDVDLVRRVVHALGDPQRAEAIRAQLGLQVGREGGEEFSPVSLASLSGTIEQAMPQGRFRGSHPYLDGKVAYRVLVMRGRCRTVAQKLGVTSLTVRDRVRRGVVVALDHAADPALEPYRYESVPMLRRKASILRPALEKAFLQVSKEKGRQRAIEERIKEPRTARYSRDVPPDFDVRLAYRVLVQGEKSDTVGMALGITGERVLQRVRNGVKLALDYAADPQLDRLRSAGLPGLRQAPSLKVALERLLSMLQMQPQTDQCKG